MNLGAQHSCVPLCLLLLGPGPQPTGCAAHIQGGHPILLLREASGDTNTPRGVPPRRLQTQSQEDRREDRERG